MRWIEIPFAPEHKIAVDNSKHTIASMQPYFLPYIGYFSLIKHTEKFIISDEPQMINDGWIHRNRVLKPVEGWYYIRVPLIKHSHKTPIKEVFIDNSENWKSKIIDQLGHYKKEAPYYPQTVNLLREAFANDFKSVVDLNVTMLKAVCEYLDIDFKYQILSEIDIDLNTIEEPDDWALVICRQLGYKKYINPIGGMDFYNKSKYTKSGIQLNFLTNNLPVYKQLNCSFNEGLSIVDVMMFNTKEEIHKMLDDIQIIDK